MDANTWSIHGVWCSFDRPGGMGSFGTLCIGSAGIPFSALGSRTTQLFKIQVSSTRETYPSKQLTLSPDHRSWTVFA
jgi:hypothetical protein